MVILKVNLCDQSHWSDDAPGITSNRIRNTFLHSGQHPLVCISDNAHLHEGKECISVTHTNT